jgi:hypothetical protein
MGAIYLRTIAMMTKEGNQVQRDPQSGTRPIAPFYAGVEGTVNAFARAEKLVPSSRNDSRITRYGNIESTYKMYCFDSTKQVESNEKCSYNSAEMLGESSRPNKTFL